MNNLNNSLVHQESGDRVWPKFEQPLSPLEIATAYLKADPTLNLVPLIDKKPFLKGWNQPQNLFGSLEDLSNWPTQATGVGVHLASSRLLSLDFDVLDKATEWLASQGFDKEQLDRLTESTLKVSSGRPNRMRLLFRQPVNFQAQHIKVEDSNGNLCLELRANNSNLQDVLPLTHAPFSLDLADKEVLYQGYFAGEEIGVNDLATVFNELPILPFEIQTIWLSYELSTRAKDKAKSKTESTISEDTKTLVELFNQNYSCEQILVSSGYKKVSSDRFLHPESSSGQAGVVLYTNQDSGEYIYSQSHGDLLSDGKQHDAFDLLRILKKDGNYHEAYLLAQSLLNNPEADFQTLSQLEDIDNDTAGYSLFYREKLEHPNYVIDGFIGDKLCIIAGAPGEGKTSCIVPLCVAITGLISFEDIPITIKRKVLYITEDAHQVDLMLHAMAKHYNKPYSTIRAEFFVLETERLSASEVAKRIAIFNERHRLNDNYPLIVLDTLSSSFDMEDENSNSKASEIIATIKQSLPAKACVWFVAHTNKNSSSEDSSKMSVRGASAFVGDANQVVYLARAGENRTLILGKRRFTPMYQELLITLVNEELTIPSNGLFVKTEIPVSFGVPRVSNEEYRERLVATVKKEKETAIRMRLQTEILELFRGENHPLTRTAISEKIIGKKETILGIIKLMLEDGLLLENRKGKFVEIYASNPEPEVQVFGDSV